MVRFAAAALALVTSLVGLSASGNEILLLEFSTTGCGPCQQMAPLIQAFEKAGYPIRKVDASREPAIAQRYGVTRFPTFLMLVDGRVIKTHVGVLDTNELQQMFQQARDTVIADQRPQPRTLTTVADERPIEKSPAAVDPSHAALIGASVRLRIDDGKYRSFGTGTIIDSREGEALIITCGHLFSDSKGKSAVNVEMFEVADGRVRVAAQVSGWVLRYDVDRDVALVVMRPGRAVTTAPIAPTGAKIERGDRVVSIGCSNGDDPTILPTRVTALDRYQRAPNIEAAGAPVEGRSGGGLFNEKGELIGVCFAADYEGNEGLYGALDLIHDEINKLKLDQHTELLADNSSTSPDESNDAPRSLPPIKYRGQNDPPVGTPTTIGPASPPSEKPAGLSPAENAAWDEIIKRATEHEMIIIVRPKEPGGQSEVITLDNVSPEFVRALSGRPREPQAPVMR